MAKAKAFFATKQMGHLLEDLQHRLANVTGHNQLNVILESFRSRVLWLPIAVRNDVSDQPFILFGYPHMGLDSPSSWAQHLISEENTCIVDENGEQVDFFEFWEIIKNSRVTHLHQEQQFLIRAAELSMQIPETIQTDCLYSPCHVYAKVWQASKDEKDEVMS